jgi:hypothetical protein
LLPRYRRATATAPDPPPLKPLVPELAEAPSKQGNAQILACAGALNDTPSENIARKLAVTNLIDCPSFLVEVSWVRTH